MNSERKVKIFRSAAEWAELINRQEGSGKTVIEFCLEQGIVRTSFEKWRRKLKGGDGAGKFQELPPEVLGGSAASAGSCEVELGGGLRLVIRR